MIKKTCINTLVLFIPAIAYACTCNKATLNILSQIKNSDYIFISKAISKEHQSDIFTPNGNLFEHKVIKVCKGHLGNTTYTFTPDNPTSCDHSPELNVIRVNFVSGSPPFRLQGCQIGGEKSFFDILYPDWEKTVIENSL